MDEVTLNVGSKDFTGWEALTVTRDLTTVADGFSMTAIFDPARPELVQAFKPFGYQAVKVTIAGDLVLTGYLEMVQPSSGPEDRAVNVQGRSLTGQLIDCYIDEIGYEWTGLTLAQIVRKVAAYFGVTVITDAVANVAIEEARADPGTTAFEFLDKLVKSMGLIMTCDNLGRLVVKTVVTKQNPVAAIVEGEGPYIGGSAQYDGTRRFSRYKVMTQYDGVPDLVGTALDSGIRLTRPYIKVGSESDGEDLNKTAAWERALALSDSAGLNVTVAGWRDAGGKVWEPGKIVTVKAPGLFILKETAFMVKTAELTMDAQSGLVTTLGLVLPETYTGELPKVTPWA